MLPPVHGIVSRKIEPNEEKDLPSLFAQLESGLRLSYRPGIGLAGVQIALPLRVAIIRIKNDPFCGDITLNLWNAKLVETSKDIFFPHEGCLSLPGGECVVKRYKSVIVENGDGKRYSLDGLGAQCVQHELDHFEGVTIVERRYPTPGRNEKCPCGTNIKYKKCCGR